MSFQGGLVDGEKVINHRMLYGKGNRVLTIVGMNFGDQINGSSVLIGSVICEEQQWANTKITCLLPTLPPGLYDIKVIVGNQGYPLIR